MCKTQINRSAIAQAHNSSLSSNMLMLIITMGKVEYDSPFKFIKIVLNMLRIRSINNHSVPVGFKVFKFFRPKD